MADIPKPGRGKPLPERFQVFEADPTAHLTEEQKKWKVLKLRPAREHFEILEQQPVLVLKLHIREHLPNVDQVVLVANISALIQALSTAECELGGEGLVLSDQQIEPGTVILILRHSLTRGAAERSVRLALMLNKTIHPSELEGAGLLNLLGKATASSEGLVHMLLAGSVNLLRCDVMTAV